MSHMAYTTEHSAVFLPRTVKHLVPEVKNLSLRQAQPGLGHRVRYLGITPRNRLVCNIYPQLFLRVEMSIHDGALKFYSDRSLSPKQWDVERQPSSIRSHGIAMKNGRKQ